MKIGFCGTGLMGRPMAERLLGAGHAVCVWNRTRAKAEPLRESGAELAERPRDAFAFGEASVLMLTDAGAVRSVLEDAESALHGRTVIQMSTIGPEESLTFAARVADRGGAYLEAPVLGSTPQAREGKLQVMVGGAPDVLARCREVLTCFGREPVLLGPVGKAAAAKLALNQLIAALSSGFALSLGLVLRHRIDVERFMGILRRSALYAPAFDAKLPRLLERDFSNPHFPVKHLAKDVDLALAEARRLGLAPPVLEAIRGLLDEAMRKGAADADYSALYEVVDPPHRRTSPAR